MPAFPAAADSRTSTYPRLIGPLGADQSVTATCVFADPIADLAVLGPPDDQALGDEHDHYTAFLSTLPPFDITAPPPRSRLRIPSEPPVFISNEISFQARLLSLDGAWLDCVACYLGGPLMIEPEKLVVLGMSGSPLLSATGRRSASSARAISPPVFGTACPVGCCAR